MPANVAASRGLVKTKSTTKKRSIFTTAEKEDVVKRWEAGEHLYKIRASYPHRTLNFDKHKNVYKWQQAIQQGKALSGKPGNRLIRPSPGKFNALLTSKQEETGSNPNKEETLACMLEAMKTAEGRKNDVVKLPSRSTQQRIKKEAGVTSVTNKERPEDREKQARSIRNAVSEASL